MPLNNNQTKNEYTSYNKKNCDMIYGTKTSGMIVEMGTLGL